MTINYKNIGLFFSGGLPHPGHGLCSKLEHGAVHPQYGIGVCDHGAGGQPTMGVCRPV